jgi:hypothetical protein
MAEPRLLAVPPAEQPRVGVGGRGMGLIGGLLTVKVTLAVCARHRAPAARPRPCA